MRQITPCARTTAIATLGLLCACAQTQRSGSQTKRAVEYWPLAVGSSWTYQIQHGGATQEESVEILSVEGEFFVDSQGARLQHHPAGVFDGQRFLLRDPLSLGAKWMAVPTANSLERFEVIAIHFTSTVPAGIFEDCVRVQATNRINEDEAYIGQWTYAPGVGLIQYQSWHESAGRDPQLQTEMLLLRFKLQPIP